MHLKEGIGCGFFFVELVHMERIGIISSRTHTIRGAPYVVDARAHTCTGPNSRTYPKCIDHHHCV